MHLGLLTSLLVHAALIGWALITIRATPPLKMPEQTPVEVAIITDDDLVRLTKGDRSSKRLEADGSEGTAKAEPKKQAKTPPPPPAAATPPPPPPPEAEPPKPDQVAALIEKEPPKPAPKAAVPAGPTAEEQKKLEETLKAEQDKAEAELALKKAADEEAKKKAADDAARKAAAEEARRKAAAEAARRKALADAARKKAEADAKAKAEADAKKFNLDDIAKKIENAPEAPDSGPKQALKDNRKPLPQAAAGAKGAPAPKGPRAGAPEGTDTQLTAGQRNALVGLLREQISRCWNINSGLTEAARLIPVFDFELNPDGSLRGEPQLVNPDPSPQFQDAANSALRALKQCAPYRDLPPDLYAYWQYSRFRFDPSQMFR